MAPGVLVVVCVCEAADAYTVDCLEGSHPLHSAAPAKVTTPVTQGATTIPERSTNMWANNRTDSSLLLLNVCMGTG